MSPRSKLYNILHCKCPRCHDGDLFLQKNPYVLNQLFDMPDSCPVCGQDFQIEPGFYLGAMWVSYPVVILLLMVFIASAHYILHLHMIASFAFATILVLLLCPLLIRYSRVVYVYIFA